MAWGIGTLAWIVAGFFLFVSLLELGEGDFASGVGLSIVFVVLLVVLRLFKVKW